MMSKADIKYALRSNKSSDGVVTVQDGMFGGVLCGNGNCYGCLMTHPASHIVWRREWADKPPYGVNIINDQDNARTTDNVLTAASPTLGSLTPEVLFVATPECSAEEEDTPTPADDSEKEAGISLPVPTLDAGILKRLSVREVNDDDEDDDEVLINNTTLTDNDGIPHTYKPRVLQTPRQCQLKSLSASLVLNSGPSPAPLVDFNKLMTPVTTRRITNSQKEQPELLTTATDPGSTHEKVVPEDLVIMQIRETSSPFTAEENLVDEGKPTPPTSVEEARPEGSTAAAGEPEPPPKKRKKRSKVVSCATPPTPKQHEKTIKRIRHIRRDQKIMKRQLHDIEVKLEIMESVENRSSTPSSTPIETESATSQTDITIMCDQESQTNATADVMPYNAADITDINPNERINQLMMLVSELEGKRDMQESNSWYQKTQLEQLQQQVAELTDEKEKISNELSTLRQEETTKYDQLMAEEKRQVDLVKDLQSKLSAEKKNTVFLRAELDKAEKKPTKHLPAHPLTDRDNEERRRQRQKQQQQYEPQPPQDPDVLFLHDSLGKGIHDTIFKNEKLGTEKALTYTLDDATKDINSRTSIPHQAVVIHVGTNDLARHPPEETVSKMEALVKSVLTKSPKSRVVVSSIVTRVDSKRSTPGRNLKPELDYVNAAIKLKLASNPNVSFVSNDNIGESYLGDDFVHLGKSGTSKLASNIKKCVAKALNIQLVKRQR